MAVWSEVKLSALEGKRRLDAEYYQPLFIRERDALRAISTVRLGDVAYVTDGQHGYHIVDENSDVKHITAKCIVAGAVVADTADRLAIKTHLSNPNSSLEDGDILLSTAGTIGNAGLVTPEILPANIDQDVARICIYDKDNLSPWYVSTFLNSTLGALQTTFGTTGQVQKHLSLAAVRDLLIPRLQGEDAIAQLAREAYDNSNLSKSHYAEAEALLLDRLGLNTLDTTPELAYERNFREVVDARRYDAEHYRPKYYRVHEALQSLKPEEFKPLGLMLSKLTNGQTPLHHDLSEGEIPFLTAEHVYDFRIDFASNKRVLQEQHEGQLQKTQLREQDILLTIKGRIGNAAVVEHLPGPCNINQDVGLLRLDPKYNPYYVVGFLNSAAGKAFTEQVCTGQINPFLGLGNLQKVAIPIFEKARMEELGKAVKEKVDEAYKARQKAEELLEQAKARVEEMILSGGMADV